jgi:hypothetical protein
MIAISGLEAMDEASRKSYRTSNLMCLSGTRESASPSLEMHIEKYRTCSVGQEGMSLH